MKRFSKRAIRTPILSRSAWAEFYRNRYNKTGDNHAAVMAVWYQLLRLALGD